LVSNSTPSTLRVKLYPAAASIARGAFIGAGGHTRNELSTWTTIRPGAARIGAGRKRIARVTIRVPRDAAPGERYGVVWAQTRGGPTAADGIVQVSRVGIRIYLSVGPGGPPAADFEIEALTATRDRSGRPGIVARVHNTGGRALDMSGTLRLDDGPGGLSAGPFPARLGVTLAIGETEPVSITLDERLPDGPWDVRVKLSSGLLDRTARATLSFPDTTESDRSSPWIPLAGVTLLLALGGTLIRRHRRRTPTRRIALQLGAGP
jgi:LPXTG-motif cell wall-anchored protein